MLHKVGVMCFAIEAHEDVPEYAECILNGKHFQLPIMLITGKKNGEFEKELKSFVKISLSDVWYAKRD